jgi:hypothetical protein
VRSALRVFGFLLFALAAISPTPLGAQDAHYWTNQFGNRARLLAGAVVGSTRDVSAVFYNPGALALVDQPELLLAGNVLELTRVRLTPEEDGANDVSTTTVRLSPSLFAGEIRTKSTVNRFAYSFLTRQSSRFEVDDRRTRAGEGLGFIANEARFESDLSEYWAGGTWARRLRSNLGIGVTQFIAVRNHSALYQDLTQALGEDVNDAALGVLDREFDYYHWRLLWKIGLATQVKNSELGVTITTPSVGIGGNGESGLTRSAVSTFPAEVGASPPEIADDSQRVSSDYRSPFSIAVGGAHRFGQTRLHLSAEWFAGESRYSILDTEPFAAQSSGEIVSTDVDQSIRDVVNFAVGVEHRFSDRLEGYGAFHTDLSAARSVGRTHAAAVPMNLYHVSGGAIVKAGNSSFTAGAVAAFGSVPLEDLGEAGDFQPVGEIRYMRLNFIVGFNFAFN